MGIKLSRHNRQYPFSFTDFVGALGLSAAGPDKTWNATQIAGGTGAIISGESNHPGIFRCASSANANSGMVYATIFNAFRLKGGEFAEFIFRLNNLTNITTRLGFIDTNSSADCVDGCYIEIPSTGDAVGKTANNSVRSTSATIATLVTSTWYRCTIELNADATLATFTIYDEAGTQLGQQTLNTNIPTAAGRETGHGYVSTHSGTASTNLIEMDYMCYLHSQPLVR